MSDVTIKKYTDIPVAEFVEGDTVLTVGSDNKLKRVNSMPGGGALQTIYIPYYDYGWSQDSEMYGSWVKVFYPFFMTPELYQYFDTVEDCANRTNGHSISDLINSSTIDFNQLNNYQIIFVIFWPTNDPTEEAELDYNHWSAEYDFESDDIQIFSVKRAYVSSIDIENTDTISGEPAAPTKLGISWSLVVMNENYNGVLRDTTWMEWCKNFQDKSGE